ncbi:MAG: chorismate-binding protein [Bdellovibrio sp.]|jgi:menaquinone-specific isochorismate synthase
MSVSESATMASSITNDKIPPDLARFLNSGAFYRLSPDRFRLYWGPWKPLADGALEGFHLAFQEFFASELKSFQATEVREFSRGDLIRFLEPGLGTGTQWVQAGFQEPDKAAFEVGFQIIQGKIQRGEIEKAVPIAVARSSAKPLNEDVLGGMLKMLSLPIDLHAYGYWHEGRGLLGATPEVLFHRKSMVVQTMALAGSMPKEDAATRTPLLKDPKEMREHELVINDLMARLKPLGWLKKHDTEVLELPTLFHLKTKFEVSGCAKRDPELVRLLHPTPALGVAPRAYGFQWLRELPDQKDRGLFGAPILFSLSNDETLALVAIRSILWDENGSRVPSGCGLVATSELEREWHELAVKRRTLFSLLGLP